MATIRLAEEVIIDPSPLTYRVLPFRSVTLDGHGGVEFASPREANSIGLALDETIATDTSDFPYVAIVAPDVILNHGFEEEITAAISDPGLDGIRWTALVSDGFDTSGRRLDTGNYLDDPATPAAAPLRIAAWADPAVAVVDAASLKDLHVSDPNLDTFTDLVDAGARESLPVFLTPRLRFSAVSERSSLEATPLRGGSGPVVASPKRIRPDPTITIVVRTLFERPELLKRNLEALAVEHDRSAILETLVVSTADISRMPPPYDGDDRGAATLPISVLQADDSVVPSRSAAMLTGMHAARGDYVWFVDDDDWVAHGSIQRIKDAVHAADRPLLIGASVVVQEQWDAGKLAASESGRRYLPDEWYRAFTGWNFLPNCSLVIPRETALLRLASSPITRNLGEDYALQLLLLTAPGSTVSVIDDTIAHISRRDDDDSAVAMTDRIPWLRDLGSHISDLSRDPSAATASFWRLGSEVRQIPYPSNTDPEQTPTGEPASTQRSDAIAGTQSRDLRSMRARIRQFIRRYPT